MANTKVEIRVAVKADAKDVYLVGSTTSLGAWDAKKAVKLEYCEKCGKFHKNVMVNDDDINMIIKISKKD